MPIESVVFDLGNVLIEWDRRHLFRKLIADDTELDRFLDEVLTLEINAGTTTPAGTPVTHARGIVLGFYD